jgi:hypothetical protein
VLARVDLRRGNHEAVEARVRPLIDSRTVRLSNKSIALHLLGRAHENLGRYEDAFAAFAAANDMQTHLHGARYANSAGAMSLRRIAALTAFVGEAEPSSWSTATPGDSDPVFFVGFPRSGTTLLDQVLASHHDIETVEEQEGLDDALEPLLLREGALSRWSTLSPEEIGQLRRLYWRRSTQSLGAPPGRKVFIDKMPLYTAVLPLIHRLFPRTKILFAVRDPRDVVISCFEQNFAMNEAMFQFLSLDTTVAYYDAVMRLAEESRRRLPLDVHVVRYEDLVQDFDRTVAGTLDFLELPWDGAVKDYAQTAMRRVLKTPSAPQVIQPIYASSIGRWRHYESQLRPHLPDLNRWAAAFGYPTA